MKPSRKARVVRRKLSRRTRPLTILQRVARLEAAVILSAAPADAKTAKPTRFTNLDASGKPTTGEHVAVHDRTTGLTWSAGPLQSGKELNHADAMKACKDLDLLGHKDWRAPTVTELLTLIDYERNDPAVHPDHFKGPFSWTWSSTIYKGSSGGAWSVCLHAGLSLWYDQGGHDHVRAVRAGQPLGLLG